ncbi:TPA: sugar phosphate isomerase/epimerase [Candidatus Poribacteria bacterium]|jgi:sugar phosphate isomerase/epimerase|nr:sugar phosphate isomerase/epimerase [Candidatus Poribacteria bacterium]HIA67727.1 sugar phosphate isomerase/epimerase [Candidatus Poribacteria bacterium]HIB87912.1 sugar phosphate isomerase/epimerase [Candidatus Poribacteria bacterium]HIB98885.1 sugar phosphate isomerase/epimerase [Candidatus Poribacteria bacterium]HIC18979.1 sugar phosphate isomerase/epimerase [Candidatus Poribacteria bacterium]
MELGFASAILPDLSLQQIVEFASSSGFSCVELMCWPKGKAERRYAGVTHVDVVDLTRDQAKQINELVNANSINISGLGYYPNPLTPDSSEAEVYVNHIRQVILAANLLGVKVVNSFIGRDWTRSVEENWPRFKEIWQPLIKFAEDHDICIAIENCPMLFTEDEWPGGKNLAYSPAIWRRMFEEIPSPNFGLNFDPSHLVWLQIDYLKPLREFSDKIFHVHAKDVRVDRHRLDEVGILGDPLEYHTPKLPGLGDVNWGQFFSVLSDVGYQGSVCIEVEDRAYEETLERRQASLIQSGSFLKQLMS